VLHRDAGQWGNSDRRAMRSPWGACRARLAHWLVLCVLLSTTVAVLTSACRDGPPYTVGLDLVNPTDVRLYVRMDGEPHPDAELHWVEPGGTLGVAGFRYRWERPRRVQAFDEQENLRFERSLPEVDLDALNWRVVLIPSGSP
jgi:hypothetical protein